jgi:gamma-glutamylcyclotransferase (GGCT)/AIG2-like uncharacterized protein YtfP
MKRPGERLMITDLFVYGTLKRGECRESLWPQKPVAIKAAYIRAQLYDLGAYPALRVDGVGVPGTWDDELDWVAGEVWSFDRDDVLATVAKLDEIEETNQPGFANLYDHVLARAYDQPGERNGEGLGRLALVYQYSDANALVHSTRLRPRVGEGFVAWSVGDASR